jgi:tRNA A37 threonylcarbamoyladenosine dehydratase
MNEALYQRTEALIGSEALRKLKDARVLVCGLGGVGGYCLEALVRAGVGTLGLCDFDRVDPTNLNRQVLALQSTVSRLKAEVAAERAAQINPAAVLKVFPMRISADTLHELDIPSWDYVADCIDDVEAKILLIKACRAAEVPILCSMGTGNKLDAGLFRVTDIRKTEQDRLAKVMRRRLREEGITSGVDALWSPEPPAAEIVGGVIPSISYMPASAGLRMAGEILRQLADI